MKKIVFTYGSLCGTVIIGSMILGFVAAKSEESALTSEWLGYTIMIVAMSLIFLGVKRYRDHELGGVIKFGTAVLCGLGITLVASAVYVVVWEIHLAMTDHAFIEDYTASIIAQQEAAGVSGEELEKKISEMEVMKTRYANPLFRLPMTFLEIFPVGLLISLLSAAVLRNSRFLAAA